MKKGFFKGLVICPHPFDTGIFDTDRISDWLQQEEWKNPDLFAVEVPRPVQQLNRGFQRLFSNGLSCHAEWKRTRPMAAIMSSDAKAFSSEENLDHFIGQRYCWIEMSAPSIEALRQAFLDPESRISLEPDPPSVLHTHVCQIRVAGTKFLQDQRLDLSPHLNCLIGGRGSGKSMLLESIRLGLRGDMAFKDASPENHVAAGQVKRLRGTFIPGKTEIELKVVHGGVEDRFVVDDSGRPADITGREVEDPSPVFRQLKALIFSQEEITQLAKRHRSLLDFVDSLASEQLEPHRKESQQIVDRLKLARQSEDALMRVNKETASLRQEMEELSRQLDAKAQVQAELKQHRAAQAADQYLQRMATKAEQIENSFREMVEEIEALPETIGSRVDTFPERGFFTEAEQQARSAYAALAESILAAIDSFQKAIAGNVLKHPGRGAVDAAIKRAEADFHQACEEKGLTPQEAEQLRETEQQQRVKQATLQAKETECQAMKAQQPDMAVLFHQLTECWRNETQTRKEILEEIITSETMPLAENGKPLVQTALTFAGNEEAFARGPWRGIAPDRRTAVGRAWDDYDRDSGRDNIAAALFRAFQEDIRSGNGTTGNPVQWLEDHWDNPGRLPDIVRQYTDDIRKVKDEKPDQWFELMLARVPDAADLVLLRADDGSPAGSFKKDDLSPWPEKHGDSFAAAGPGSRAGAHRPAGG